MMSVQALSGVTANLLAEKEDESIPKLTGSQSFSYALDAAKNLIDTNIEAATVTENKTVDFMTGQNDNIVDLLVAQEKSGILLQYSLQVRNGLLSAYKEIMNLSI